MSQEYRRLEGLDAADPNDEIIVIHRKRDGKNGPSSSPALVPGSKFIPILAMGAAIAIGGLLGAGLMNQQAAAQLQQAQQQAQELADLKQQLATIQQQAAEIQQENVRIKTCIQHGQ